MRAFPTGYQWDPHQDAKLCALWGFGFDEALKIFSDPEADCLISGPRVYPSAMGPEERFTAIGRMETGVVVAVYYTMRGTDKRLIDVRFTTREERAAFNLHNGIPDEPR